MNPSDLNSEPPTLVADSVNSWIGRQVGDFTINPKARNQCTTTNFGINLEKACVHCAFCPVIETTCNIAWARANDPKINADHRVDLDWLVQNFRPPSSALKFVPNLKNLHPWPGKEGKVKSVNQGPPRSGNRVRPKGRHLFPFEVTDSRRYVVGKKNLIEVDKDLREEYLGIVRQHLETTGPVVATFFPSKTYNPYDHDVYDTDGTVVNYHDLINGNNILKTERHAVCVTGTAKVLARGAECDAFEYLESEEPEKCKHGEGKCYMTARSVYSFTIPTIKS